MSRAKNVVFPKENGAVFFDGTEVTKALRKYEIMTNVSGMTETLKTTRFAAYSDDKLFDHIYAIAEAATAGGETGCWEKFKKDMRARFFAKDPEQRLTPYDRLLNWFQRERPCQHDALLDDLQELRVIALRVPGSLDKSDLSTLLFQSLPYTIKEHLYSRHKYTTSSIESQKLGDMLQACIAVITDDWYMQADLPRHPIGELPNLSPLDTNGQKGLWLENVASQPADQASSISSAVERWSPSTSPPESPSTL